MKHGYEGLFIFPKELGEEALEAALAQVREEIKKLGGTVRSVTRMGKRSFARPLAKRRDAGHYAVFEFELDGSAVAPLQARFKLNPNIFRVQLVRTKLPAKEAAKETEEAAP